MLTTVTSNPNRLSRRAAIGVAATVGVSATIGVSAGTAAFAQTGRAPRMASLAASSARATVAQDLTAVRVFPSYTSKVYGQHAAVLGKLGELGIKRMSHKLTPAIAGQASFIKFTQDAYRMFGIKSWLTIGEPRVPLSAAEWTKIVGVLSGPLAGMVERVYGWNEPNHGRGGAAFDESTWAPMTGAHQTELWKRVSPLGIKVGTPQLWSGTFSKHDADLTKLAPLIRGKFDHIGWHLYPRSGGAENTRNVTRFAALYSRLLGTGFQVICTEAGYLDALNYTGGANNTTQAQKAILVPLLVDEYVNRGWGLSYFELLDDPDPTEADREASLGMVECTSVSPATWTNKPCFTAMKTRLARA